MLIFFLILRMYKSFARIKLSVYTKNKENLFIYHFYLSKGKIGNSFFFALLLYLIKIIKNVNIFLLFYQLFYLFELIKFYFFYKYEEKLLFRCCDLF